MEFVRSPFCCFSLFFSLSLFLFFLVSLVFFSFSRFSLLLFRRFIQGQPVNGVARFDLQVNNAQVGTYDQHDEWRPQDIEDSNLPYFFSRSAHGAVTAVHHDPSEKYFSLQLKHEIAKMFNTDLKGDENFNTPSVALFERGAGAGGGSVKSTHKRTVLLEKTATHLVVRKTRSAITQHRVFSGQGDGLATLHHRGEASLRINKDTKDIEQATIHDHVQTESEAVLDDDNLGPQEKCNRNDDPLCHPKQGGPRGESVDAHNEEGLTLISRVVLKKNSGGAKTISSFLETSMRGLKTVPLSDDGHIPTRAEQQEMIHQHLSQPAAQLPTTQAHLGVVDYLLNEKSGDRDHRTFQKLANIVRHRPKLVQEIYERAAAMTGKLDELDEYSRIVNVLAASGTEPAQRALLALLADREEKSQYQRHITLNTLGFTKYSSHSDVIDALEDMVFHQFGNQTAQNMSLTDPVAAFAPLVLGTVVHFRHHTGHVNANERDRTAALQNELERRAQIALDDGHAKQHKIVWINTLGNTGRQSSLPILAQYLDEHRADPVSEREHDDMIRAAAVMALRQVPGNHSEDLINTYLSDPAPKVREAAANVYANHRQAGEGSAELIHKAWLKEQDANVLSLLEKAKIKVGHTLGLVKPKNVLDEVAMPYTKGTEQKMGSEPNYMAFTADFTLQFMMPVAKAEAGLMMHTLGNDVIILGIGLQVTPTCFKKKSSTRIVPYVVVFNQEIAIPVSKTMVGLTIGACEDDDDPEPAPKTAKEIAARHKTTKKEMEGTDDKVDTEDSEMGEGAGEGKEILTPVCGEMALQDIWSQSFTAPPAPLGRFMTAIGPVILTISIEVEFTIGIEGNVGSCWGGDYEQDLAKKDNLCDSKNVITSKKECHEDAFEDVGFDEEEVTKKEVSWKDLPKGCSYRAAVETIYYNKHSTGGNDGLYAPICKVEKGANPRDDYQFIGAFGPYISVGLKVTASVGYPFILNVNVAITIDFFKLQPVTTLTVSNGEDKAKDIPVMISASDFYVHLLAGAVELSITFLPDILDFEVSLIKVQFPGPDGKYACVTSAFNPKLECPDEYFINAPGGATDDAKLVLSEFPISMWCTQSPGKKSMCPWQAGRKSEEDMAADQSLDLARGKCKQAYHCQNKDFDGHVMEKGDVMGTIGTQIFDTGATFRDKSNYRSDGSHKNVAYSKTFGTELIAGVERPIQSYVTFDVAGEQQQASTTTATAGKSSEKYIIHKLSDVCKPGTIITSVAECKRAFLELGLGWKPRNGWWAQEISGKSPFGCQFGSDGTPGFVYQAPHDKSACRENGKLDGDCCALKGDASCKDGYDLSYQDHITNPGKNSNERGKESICWKSGKKHFYRYSCRSKKPTKLHNNAPGRSVYPVCKREKTCGTVVLAAEDGKTGYVFDFGGNSGQSSIRKANLGQFSSGHNKNSCRENGKVDSDCCASKSAASCANGNTLIQTERVCWDGKKFKKEGGLSCASTNCAFLYKCLSPKASAPTIQSYIDNGVKAYVPEFTTCSSDTPLPFWVRTDTYGHAAMGTGSKVGVNTLLQWKDPDPIKWVGSAGVGSPDSSSPVKFTKLEANRGAKDEVYCWPPNNEEDPEHEDFNDLGTCYRKIPDSYLDTKPHNNVRTNPQRAPQLKCNKGNTMDPLFEACISGVCRDFGVNVLRCAGCDSDKDCSKRTYIGTDCNAPGTRVAVKRHGVVQAADVKDFDGANKQGWGAPNNGKIRVNFLRGGSAYVDRSEAYFCPSASYSLYQYTFPSGCMTSCAISGEQCPLEQPSSPGMEPDTCWDGSKGHEKGNRPVCVFEERQGDNWGPRKYFCAAKGYAGAWCDKDSHCGAGSVCSFWRCTRPKKDYEICAGGSECISGKCDHVYGATKKCRPDKGWRDYTGCDSHSHCESRSCMNTFAADRKCKPKGGWKQGDQCTASSHCESGICKGGLCAECSSWGRGECVSWSGPLQGNSYSKTLTHDQNMPWANWACADRPNKPLHGYVTGYDSPSIEHCKRGCENSKYNCVAVDYWVSGHNDGWCNEFERTCKLYSNKHPGSFAMTFNLLDPKKTCDASVGNYRCKTCRTGITKGMKVRKHAFNLWSGKCGFGCCSSIGGVLDWG